MVNVGKLTILTDFHVIRPTEADKGGRPQVLLGRPFLKAARFKLQYDDDTFSLSVRKITEVFHVTRPPAPRKKGSHQLRVGSKKIEPEKLLRSEGKKESESPKNDGFIGKGLRIAPPQLKKKRKKVPLNLEKKKEKKKKKQEEGKSEKKMMASKGKAPARAPPTRVSVDKKGKKVVQTQPTRASARLAVLKTRTSPTPPPTSSTPAMSQPAVKKPIFIDLTKDSESEGRSKEENPEWKLANTLRKMIGLRELDSDDSDLGFSSSPSSSSEEDDVLRNDPGFWDYDDLDDWGAVEPATSSEASCTSHHPPNH
ncbi:hypothetical protein PIB30_088299 [Stylosanthes scabra]|uniref:Uncharacterized protein n=1 Tax=Stylosanthes scabra TaxID=79078 RepID=A0ABU6QT67_9FABA|nr:hypothetical protein [Stylosanthes scabra]